MVLKTPKANLPALHGRLVVDTVNGKVRVRKWPEKRGKNVPPQVRIQNERFAAAQRLSKEIKGSIMNRFIDATKDTGLYPRDLLTKMMLAPPIELETPEGRVIRYGRPTLETVVFQGCILRLAGTFSIPSGGIRTISWPVPDLDTSAMFDAAQPDRITIPPGVAVVRFTAGWSRSSGADTFVAAFINQLPATQEGIATSRTNDGRGTTVDSGPVIVSEGDQFAFQMATLSNIVVGNGATFFAAEILAAEV